MESIKSHSVAAIVVLACVVASSCEKRGDTVREVHLGGVIKSPDFGSTRGEDGSYWITWAGDPAKVVYGIFSDGRHIVRGSAGGTFMMVDRTSDEEWTLTLSAGQQVLVQSDRTTKDVLGFAHHTGSGIGFSQTEDQILRRVVATHAKITTNEQDARDNQR